ncbi:hypothetical protein [Actinomadura algeriensis]|uniref:Uncharacterized protein n=1 Tax=Actinomadura algeriensis TaxID=1679523 RepID=A0ABR9JWN1_9ACTN|nr:hypothetical protein [Actinomadura algeriensis]MBE1534980.1 hypothetical protein [Actinomadura algeriensis]
MTTDPDEHGEILRRALNAEAESVIPADDGLDRIRARIAEGGKRRGPLGRFALARLGPAGLTVGWARPVLAVAAAVAIAGFGVTAGPQTIELIQHTVTGDGPSGGEGDNSTKDRTGAHAPPVVPGDPSSPAPSTTATPSTSEEPGAASSSPGLSSCVIPRGGTAATPSSPPPSAAPETGGTAGTPCPGGRTPTPSSPTDAPSTTPPPPDPSPEPTNEPSPTASGTPSTTSEQDAAPAGP